MINILIRRDKSILTKEENIENKLNKIISKINFENVISVEQIINQIYLEYLSITNENKLIWTYLINTNFEKTEFIETDKKQNYSLTVTIGLNKGYKWYNTRTKKAKQFHFENKIYIKENKAHLYDKIEKIESSFNENQIKNYNKLENIVKTLNDQTKLYQIELMNKNESEEISNNYVIELKLKLNDDYYWILGNKLIKKDVILKFIINKTAVKEE